MKKKKAKSEGKTRLTPNENLEAAYRHIIKGEAQHRIAQRMGGVNPGRVADAVLTARKWMRNPAAFKEYTPPDGGGPTYKERVESKLNTILRRIGEANGKARKKK